MIYDYEAAEGEGEEVDRLTTHTSLNADKEYVHAKAFLQKASSATGENLYDHLSDVLNKILAERPENIIDFFEEYSRKVKERRFKSALDHLEDIYVPKARYDLSYKTMELFKPIQIDELSTVDPADIELADMTQNNMVQLLYYLEQAGIGLSKQEMFSLIYSMKKLINLEPIASIRFWGIVYGLYSNYFVVETELKEEEYMKRNKSLHEDETTDEVASATSTDAIPQKPMEEDEFTLRLHQMAQEQQMGGEDSKFPRPLPPFPLNLYQKPPDIPVEPSGVGVNSKVYYVTTDLTEPWEQLPDVTPQQITIARKIHKAFTGKLDQDVVTYPEFPGKEREFLRAQIARISASTQISPLGYYTFETTMGGEGADEEEEPEVGDEEVEIGKTYRVNPKYDPVPLKDLIDNSMSFWVHHVQYIFPQGRTSWWSPVPDREQIDEELDEAAAEEEEDRVNLPNLQIEPETGPPLLTPLSEDAYIENVPPWSVRCSSNLMEDFAIATVRSHLWPGAYCFATQGKLFQNIYLGNGLKYQVTNFSPTPLPMIQQDYPQGPEIMEMFDPTGVEEENWRIAHLPKPKDEEKLDEEEEEEEEEDEEDEEED